MLTENHYKDRNGRTGGEVALELILQRCLGIIVVVIGIGSRDIPQLVIEVVRRVDEHIVRK